MTAFCIKILQHSEILNILVNECRVRRHKHMISDFKDKMLSCHRQRDHTTLAVSQNLVISPAQLYEQVSAAMDNPAPHYITPITTV